MTNETKEQDAGLSKDRFIWFNLLLKNRNTCIPLTAFEDGAQAYHAELERYLREASLECESGEAELRSSWIIEHMKQWLAK